MRGRKPKPTHLKLIQGNPSGRPLNKREPKPRPAVPSCPSHLDAVAKAEWRRVVPLLAQCGLLTSIDRAALAAYCQCWARWIEAERTVAKEGSLIEASSGYLMPHPCLAIAHRAVCQMQNFMTEFGMTPSARSRVAAGAPPSAADPFDALLDG
jgi:P27 family predicted phage terminase small subunit